MINKDNIDQVLFELLQDFWAGGGNLYRLVHDYGHPAVDVILEIKRRYDQGDARVESLSYDLVSRLTDFSEKIKGHSFRSVKDCGRHWHGGLKKCYISSGPYYSPGTENIFQQAISSLASLFTTTTDD